MDSTASHIEPEKDQQKITCGLVMPISSIDGCTVEHWEEVREIINVSLGSEKYKIQLVSTSDEVGIIQNRIVSNLYSSDIVICDVSAKNPNVMFELGMRLAFDKPTIIIKDDKTNYSFDTSVIEHLEYPRDLHYHSIEKFKGELKRKVEATMKAFEDGSFTTFLGHFGEFKVSEVSKQEITASDYIISTLQSLELQIQKLSFNQKRNLRWIDLDFENKERQRLIEKGINQYIKHQGIKEIELNDSHKSQAKDYTAKFIMSTTNLDSSEIKEIIEKNFDKEFSAAQIPF